MRKTSLVALAVLASVPFLISQDSSTNVKQPGPALPAEVLGPPLIAWSQVQKPHPLQQQEQPSSDAAGGDQTGGAPAAQQPITGTIVKEGSRFVLKVSENTVYQIDNQEKARLYEGKQVKIAGSLDTKTNTIHITKIELLS
jgi:uncharacterized protein DUF5818